MKKYAQALGEILYRRGVLSKDDSLSLVQDFKGTEQAQLNYFLLDEGLVTKEELLQALSEYYKVPFFDVRGFQFNHDLLSLFPQDFLIHNAIVPIEFDGNILTVVAGDPNQLDLREEIQQYTSYYIEFRVGIVRDIIDEARAYYENPPDELEIEEDNDGDDELETTDDIVDLY